MTWRQLHRGLWRWDARRTETWDPRHRPAGGQRSDRGTPPTPLARGAGFGPKVQARAGETVWRTSVFPDLGVGVFRAAGEARCAKRRVGLGMITLVLEVVA